MDERQWSFQQKFFFFRNKLTTLQNKLEFAKTEDDRNVVRDQIRDVKWKLECLTGDKW